MIHLHTHSHYSVLDGLGKVQDIVAKAKELNAPAVAITDHASISCVAEFMKEAEEAGVNPIIGCEFYVVDEAKGSKDEKRFHLTVWAKNWAGVESIMSQLTLANQQFYRRPRITLKQALNFKNCCIGTGCAIGILARDSWEQDACKLYLKYGVDFYLEVMPHSFMNDGIDMQRTANERAITLSDNYGIKLLATNDAHYVNQEDAHTHEILLAIQTSKNWNDPKRWAFPGTGFFMRSQSEMIQAFIDNCKDYILGKHICNSIKNTNELAEKIDIKMPKFEVKLPSIYENENDVLMNKIMSGWKELLPVELPNKQEYVDRLKFELGVISSLGFIPYFLIVDDIIRWSRNNGILVGPARGSAAGSLVCYLMGITQVDPIKHELYFERFLNPERIDLPDIDVDFQDDRRQEVFEYIRNKYGYDKTAQINTFGKLTVKNAFRDVARVFGITPLQTNLLSKEIEDAESFDKVPELMKFKKANGAIVEQAIKLKGTIRQQGVHACGLVVSSSKLENVSVIEKRKDSEVVNWDKGECENFGLLKIDVLGLSTLTILGKTVRLIKERHGKEIILTDIPLDDPKTLNAFSEGNGIGIFQFENSGMQNLLKELKANDFGTITDTTALFRPGSLNSGQTDRYKAISRGNEYETYVCPQLEPILKPTKSVMVYQEQIMRIFNELAGFSWAEADKMRKIISKSQGKDVFNKHKDHFILGCGKNGIDGSIADDLFGRMAEFASYSFNKSHAVAYTMISFWAMYMKVNYPLEFMTGVFDSVKNEKIMATVTETERLGIKLRQPDINVSTDKYIIENNEIVAPLSVIKGVGNKAVDEILNARATGVFLSVDDLNDRVVKRIVHKGIVDKLIRAGAFESLGIREQNPELRNKEYNELLPIFNKMPKIAIDRIDEYDRVAWVQHMRDINICGKMQNKTMIPPFVNGHRQSVMVINNTVAGEKNHFVNKGSKHFMSAMTNMGFKPEHFYYTSPVKCFHEKKTNPPKECIGKCTDFLKKEIEIVKPKLIICFASAVFNLFADKKQPAGKMNGVLTYKKEYDCYVLFSYSPQYAFFNEDKVGKAFEESMSKMGNIFY